MVDGGTAMEFDYENEDDDEKDDDVIIGDRS